jgi:FkbM family methyltransferase
LTVRNATLHEFLKRLAKGLLRITPLRWLLRKAALSDRLPRALWTRLPVEGVFEIDIGKSQTFHYFCEAGDRLGHVLHWRGLHEWESETLALFIPIVKQGRAFIDVGAYTGVYSLIACAANPNVNVIAIEPVPKTFDVLRKNVHLNGFQGRCQLMAIAVGECKEHGRMYLPSNEKFPSMACLVANAAETSSNYIDVEVYTLDDICGDRDDVDLIKIDVEGRELDVLKGMRRVMSKCRPAIIIEVLQEAPTVELQDLLTAFGYIFFVISKTGLIPAERIEPQIKAIGRNYLCITPDRVVDLGIAA